MENKLYRLVFFTMVFFFAVGAQAQRRNSRYVEYINKYSDLAVEQMKLHKIPASITLAQGLLESGAGYSQLARKSNNHFGIKCGGTRNADFISIARQGNPQPSGPQGPSNLRTLRPERAGQS